MNNSKTSKSKTSDKVVIFLSEGGYKISSLYGKILSKKPFATLAAARNACEDNGTEYIIA